MDVKWKDGDTSVGRLCDCSSSVLQNKHLDSSSSRADVSLWSGRPLFTSQLGLADAARQIQFSSDTYSPELTSQHVPLLCAQSPSVQGQFKVFNSGTQRELQISKASNYFLNKLKNSQCNKHIIVGYWMKSDWSIGWLTSDVSFVFSCWCCLFLDFFRYKKLVLLLDFGAKTAEVNKLVFFSSIWKYNLGWPAHFTRQNTFKTSLTNFFHLNQM